MARLREALHYFRLPISYSAKELEACAKTLLATAPPDCDHRLRITVVRRGQAASVTMAYAPLGPPPEGIELVPTDIIRAAGNPTARFKTLAYTDHLVAQRDLKPGQMALLCNQWGRVACGAYANVFVRRGGVWVTPSVAEGALPGVVRAELLAKGAVEGRVELAEMREAEVLVTNSLIGAVPGLLAGSVSRRA